MKRREIVLNEDQVRAMLQKAKETSQRDHLLLSLMVNCGFRRAELVGGDDGRVPEQKRLPGIRIENLRDGGVYILGKKADREVLVPIPLPLLTEIHQYIGKRTTGPLFDYSTDGVRKVCLKYAKAAGIPDWERAHPHRLRHFFITRVAKQTGRDPWKTRDLARHKNIATTNRYVAELDPGEKAEIARQIEIV